MHQWKTNFIGTLFLIELALGHQTSSRIIKSYNDNDGEGRTVTLYDIVYLLYDTIQSTILGSQYDLFL